jgi:hypothetical protein
MCLTGLVEVAALSSNVGTRPPPLVLMFPARCHLLCCPQAKLAEEAERVRGVILGSLGAANNFICAAQRVVPSTSLPPVARFSHSLTLFSMRTWLR